MSLSSIHIQKANSNCFKHNAREEKNQAKTIHSEHTDKNTCNINSQEAQKIFDNLYQERIQRSSNNNKPKKENCLIEAVINIEPDTTQKQLKEVSKYIEKEFSFKLLQTAIHKDEGHIKNDRLEVNYHSHMVFATINENGKQMYRREHINRDKLSKLQDYTAKALKMERGEINSKAKRLSHKDFKEHRKRVEPLENEIKNLKIINTEIVKLSTQNDKNKSLDIKDLKDELKKVKKTFKIELQTQKDKNRELRAELQENQSNRSDYAKLETENKERIETLRLENEKAMREIQEMIKQHQQIQRELSQSLAKEKATRKKLAKYEKTKDRGMGR